MPVEVRLTEITAEFRDAKNRSIVFPPLRTKFRGRWDRINMHGMSIHQSMQAMPDIPGLQIQLDPKRKQGRVFDPLAQPEHADTVRLIKKLVKDVFRRDQEPAKEILKKDMSDTDIKTWLYWLKRLADAKKISILSGVLPSYEEIASLPGKTGCEYWNQGSEAKRFKEDMDKP